MCLSIIFLPLLTSIFILSFGRFLSILIVKIFVFFFAFISFLWSVYIFITNVLTGTTLVVILPVTWFKLGTFEVEWTFVYDSLSCSMLMVVFLISFLVQVYSYEYMGDDPHFFRYIAYLNLFTFFMVFLLTGGNFLQIFFGWEGVGLCSYLLVNFWYTRIQANKSAFKAMIVNRVGDWFLAIGIALLFNVFGSVDCFFLAAFVSDANLSHFLIFLFGYQLNILDLIAFFLMFGVFAKSAQFGLHIWLPDAMEGPTPVSALIHAATMVTAGIFLILRGSFIFESTGFIMFIISVFGAITAIFGSTTACFQTDIKKVIAYSTCSQLGYMLFACGLSLYSTALFHLVNHAFFKALLFLGAGAIIHSFYGEQDLSIMDNVDDLIPFTSQMFSIACLVLSGFPFLGAFYSKDFIFESLNGFHYLDGIVLSNLILHAAIYTGIYSTNLCQVFEADEEDYEIADMFLGRVNESGICILSSLLVLTIISIFSGFFLKDIFIGAGSSIFSDSISLSIFNQNFLEADFLPASSRLFPFYFSFFFASVIGFFDELNFFGNSLFRLDFLSKHVQVVRGLFRFVADFFQLLWLYNSLVNVFLVSYLFKIFNYLIFKVTDKGIFEIFGPQGISLTIQNVIISNIPIFITGYIFHYTFLIVFGLVIFFLFIIINQIFAVSELIIFVFFLVIFYIYLFKN